MRNVLALAIVGLTGCASAHLALASEVLVTEAHTLTVWSHCQEGEVGCAKLSAQLVNKQSGQAIKLRGSTHMVKCADRVTPCHVGYYDLKSSKTFVRAYPDGTLEIDASGSAGKTEHGTWRY